MRNDITHLPTQVQNDLAYITEFLVKDYEVAASNGTSNKQNCANITNIILHGCFTEDHWQPDTELRPAEEVYSYNILITVTKILPDTFYQIQEVERQLNRSGEVEHSIELQIETVRKVNKLLKDGYLVYDQIRDRGILLYNNGAKGRNLFHMPDQPNAAKHYIRARDHFERVFPLAKSFLKGAQFFRDTDYNAAAFMLNISAEQAYEAFMLVHVLYYPYSRTLTDLRETSESIHQELQFVWAGREGRQSFFKLKCAFKGPRYTPDYMITRIELDRLFRYVKELHKLVHYICRLKFEELKTGSLKKPAKDWLEIIGEVLTYPKRKPAKEDVPEDEKEDESGPTETPAIETTDTEVLATGPVEEVEPVLPDPRPFCRTAAQEQALEELSRKLFDLENPCCELETIADVMRCLAWEGGELEHRGVGLMGQVFRDRATFVKDSFYQIMDLMRESRIDDDVPVKEEAAGG